jgi:hypothetical protein
MQGRLPALGNSAGTLNHLACERLEFASCAFQYAELAYVQHSLLSIQDVVQDECGQLTVGRTFSITAE